MSIDNWIENGVGGEDRRRYDDALSRRERSAQPQRTRAQEAELAQVEREAAALRQKLGLCRGEG